MEGSHHTCTPSSPADGLFQAFPRINVMTKESQSIGVLTPASRISQGLLEHTCVALM